VPQKALTASRKETGGVTDKLGKHCQQEDGKPWRRLLQPEVSALANSLGNCPIVSAASGLTMALLTWEQRKHSVLAHANAECFRAHCLKQSA